MFEQRELGSNILPIMIYLITPDRNYIYLPHPEA